MKRSRFSEEQIIGILKEQEAGVPVDCQSAWNVDPRSAPKTDPSVGVIAVAVGAEP